MFFLLNFTLVWAMTMGVILAKLPQHTVVCFSIISVSLSSTMWYVGCEFLALIVILMYIGATTILYMFFITLVPVNRGWTTHNIMHIYYLPFFVKTYDLVTWNTYITTPFSCVKTSHFWADNWLFLANDSSIFGTALFTAFWPLTLITAVILLVAMLGGLSLCLTQK